MLVLKTVSKVNKKKKLPNIYKIGKKVFTNISNGCTIES